ncbi:MAG: ATP-binding protein [Candidatus Aegiribacteria sp.]|nr:ATP-binding protein [Candidatus Aegiribacteria sp.]
MKLREAFKFISGRYDFDVTVGDNSQWTLQYTSPGDEYNWYRAYESGRGLSFVLFALCFILSPDYAALLIDEPEMHLHPEMQKRLYQVMMESGKQFFLSTHANTFIDPSQQSKVFMLTNNGRIEATPITRKAIALSDLGYSITDNLVCDLIVLVEGSHDKPVIEWLLEQMLGKEYSIKVWPLGGNNMEHVDLEVFTESCEVVAVIDKDPGSEKSRSRFEKKCKDAGVCCYRLERYAAENYLTLSALREVLESDIPGKLTSIPHDKKMKEILGFRVKSRIQEILSHMTLADIKDTDLYNVAQDISARILAE